MRRMTRGMTAVLMVLAAPAFAQTAASVCGTVLMSSDRIACLQAVAGHTVEPGAARVCNAVLMGPDKTACLVASLDKHYEPAELQACNSILMGPDKANCMASTGARFQVQEQPRQRRRDDGSGPGGPGPGGPGGPGAVAADRLIRLTNQHRGIVDRFYWRGLDQRRFREVRVPQVMSNTSVDVTVPAMNITVCVETPDGYRLFWPQVGPGEQLTIAPGEQNWVLGKCADR